MFYGQFGADFKQAVFRHSELAQLFLRLNIRLGKMSFHRLRHIFGLYGAGAQLNGGIAVAFHGSDVNDLKIVDGKNRNRHMSSVSLKNAGHSQLFCD